MMAGVAPHIPVLLDEVVAAVQPEAGKLLCWNNLLGDGRTNPDTLHQGTKVRKGTKYVITKWYREKPLATKPV